MTDAQTTFRSELRARFSAAMSEMYRQEVPAYGTLLQLVEEVNQVTLDRDDALCQQLSHSEDLTRISAERHGAIRLGTAEELALMRRIFAVMGMYPVGYYDLSVAGIPVHSTAFRPVESDALKRNPFRVFTSLLRVELIQDTDLRQTAQAILARRQIFTDRALMLLDKAETQGTLAEDDASFFIAEVTETFKWHAEAAINHQLYQRLHDTHRLIADVVSFRGPHINHLTPRTLDIDTVQTGMSDYGITPKAVIEGPPRRRCPILLRQTSFKALEEPVMFPENDGGQTTGHHTARFGEIEQRGVALTPKGRALYDQLLAATREQATPAADGSNATAYHQLLAEVFVDFPDTWAELRAQDLAYFRYRPLAERRLENPAALTVDTLVADGYLAFEPITYEDFLPVSAAGIFQSNLGDRANEAISAASSRQRFEQALGCQVLDECFYYAKIQASTLKASLAALSS